MNLHSKTISRTTGFTLVEVLAALLLMAIVLPVAMKGMSLATGLASGAVKRTRAASLASSKIAELVATDAWQTGTLAGDFSPDSPDVSWQATLIPWASDTSNVALQELDVTVTWTDRLHPQSVQLSTLVYDKTSSTTSTQ